MRRMLSILMLALAIPAAGNAQRTVAVFPFVDQGSYGQDKEVFAALELGLQSLLVDELERFAGLRLIESPAPAPRAGAREGVRVIDAATAARAGKDAGAALVVLGAFVDHYGRFRLDARIVDTETGRILEAVTNDGALQERQDLHAMVQSLASRIGAALDLPAAPGAPAPVSGDAVTWYSRGVLHRARGESAEAIAAFDRALEAAPGFAAAREARGR
jgi:TolB-like protein